MPRLQLIGPRSVRAGLLDLSLQPGECLAITGPSGAGKSLMLRMIADLDPHDCDALLDGCSRVHVTAADWHRSVVYCAAGAAGGLTVGADFETPPLEAVTALGTTA